MCDGGDVLLYSLSAWRETPWATFKKCFDEIHRRHVVASIREEREAAAFRRWGALRLLSALGHVDVTFQQQGIAIAVAPPALAVLPGFGMRRAILCGARSPSTVDDLKRAAAREGVVMTTDSQQALSPYAPTRAEIKAENGERLRTVAGTIGVSLLDQPAARALAQFSVSLEDYCRNLCWSPEPEFNWHCEDFTIGTLQFQPRSEPPPLTRLSRYQDPVTTIWRYRLWREGQSAAIEPDWGRYAILSAHSKAVLQFDADNRDVLVPLGTPLPALLARALGLCSGYASHRRRHARQGRPDLPILGYEAFRDVPPSIFRLVADKVGQPHLGLGS